MNHYDQNQPQVAYPPPGTAYPAAVAPPPPAGYPMRDDQVQHQNPQPLPQTQSRGDGFWKGCIEVFSIVALLCSSNLCLTRMARTSSCRSFSRSFGRSFNEKTDSRGDNRGRQVFQPVVRVVVR